MMLESKGYGVTALSHRLRCDTHRRQGQQRSIDIVTESNGFGVSDMLKSDGYGVTGVLQWCYTGCGVILSEARGSSAASKKLRTSTL
jgi:hypothetical protein